ncbi:MAG TPA: hypothetical protein ENG02_00710, partial [Candidatus Woesearchaeota archaeon]|nr:hypothetical protein [Candidatus Woesearchaeota archaeon]
MYDLVPNPEEFDSKKGRELAKRFFEQYVDRRKVPLVARQETKGYPSLLEYIAYHAQDCKYVNLNGYMRKVDAVIGQEKTLFKLLLAAIQPKSFCLEGPAGSGKTLMMYSLLSLLPSEDVYLFEMSTDTVLFL